MNKVLAYLIVSLLFIKVVNDIKIGKLLIEQNNLHRKSQKTFKEFSKNFSKIFSEASVETINSEESENENSV